MFIETSKGLIYASRHHDPCQKSIEAMNLMPRESRSKSDYSISVFDMPLFSVFFSNLICECYVYIYRCFLIQILLQGHGRLANGAPVLSVGCFLLFFFLTEASR